MTKLLERAYDRIASLPEADQDAMAAIILETIADDAEWDTQFARSQDLLERLSEEALTEHRAGRTLPLDPASL